MRTLKEGEDLIGIIQKFEVIESGIEQVLRGGSSISAALKEQVKEILQKTKGYFLVGVYCVEPTFKFVWGLYSNSELINIFPADDPRQPAGYQDIYAFIL